MTDTEKARQFFQADRFAVEATGIEILEARQGYAKCALKIEARHKNAAGQVMGGVLFTMADFAFAVAANLHQPTTVTQTSQIVFLSAAKGDTLFAETECIRAGKRSCVYKILVSDNTERQIAYVTATGIVVGE